MLQKDGNSACLHVRGKYDASVVLVPASIGYSSIIYVFCFFFAKVRSGLNCIMYSDYLNIRTMRTYEQLKIGK